MFTVIVLTLYVSLHIVNLGVKLLPLTSFSSHRDLKAGASDTQEREISSRLSDLVFVNYELSASELMSVNYTRR